MEINGRAASVSVSRRDGRFVVALGDKQWTVDAAAIGTHGLSMLIEREVRVDGAALDPALWHASESNGWVCALYLANDRDLMMKSFRRNGLV